MAIQRDKVIASAEKLVAKGKIEPAIKEYERLLDDNPNDVNTLNRIGDLWVRINRNEEAVKVFAKIADHYSKDGFFLKAIAIYKKINKLDPSKLEIYARLADLYAKQGLAMEAKSQYQVLADYYLKHGDPGNALAIYRKISELDPTSINVHVKLADLYSQNNQIGDALKEYDRVGRLLLKRGMLDEAVQVFRKALKVDAKSSELAESLVTALLEAKDYDNAAQIVGVALEANPENPRLLATLGKIQLAKGDANAARATLERGIAIDANDPALRETLADLYLRQNAPDRALEMLVPLVEKALGRAERGVAVEMLTRVLRVDAGHAPTLERLVATYSRLNEETNILAAMNSLAEAHVAKGRYEDAAKVLERLIDREPQNAQHRNKLQFVRTQMGGVDTIPGGGRARTSPSEIPMPAMEIEEPPPTFDFAEDSGPAISLDLDSSPPLELDFSGSASPSAAPSHLVSAVEQAAADLQGEGGDDLDFITEHLTEAEVFAKYGLAEKAAEHLRAVLERAPKNLTAHERLLRVLLDEGDIDAARAAGQAYVAVLDERGDAAAIATVRSEFATRGQTFDASVPRRPASPPTVERKRPPTLETPAPAPAPAVEEIEEELTFDLDGDTPEIELAASEPEIEMELELDQPETAPEIAEEIAEPALEMVPDYAEIELEAETLAPEAVAEPSISFEHDLTADSLLDLEPEPELTSLPDLEPELGPELLESIDAPSLSPIEALSFDDSPGITLDETPAPSFSFDEPSTFAEPEPTPALESLSFDEPAPALESLSFGEPVAASEPFYGVEADGDELMPELEEPTAEELNEVDFYIEQELLDEARDKVDALLVRFPGHEGIERRRDRIEAAMTASAAAATIADAAVTPAPEPVPAPVPTSTLDRPAALSRDEIESELLSAIPDDDDDIVVTPPVAAPPISAPSRKAVEPKFSATSAQEENLFADEEDFFDLAAELESELNEDEEQISLSEEEQSLEEIFREFKKGVEQQLDSEDYDTHYNLGIAYKEMGLIDEAIGEFQLASKDPKRAVECSSMLGLCFLEKGMPQLAIKWYRKGLEMPEITEEEHIGLLYDLGSAYQEVGDTENAQKAFMEVYGMNSTYRDIVSRIKQLEDARK